MKTKNLFSLFLCLSVLFHFTFLHAENNTPNDSIKTYSLSEVLVVFSPKETNKLQTLPGSVSFLSSQIISERHISALKDLSSFIPNFYIPDYGAKLTSAVYIRGIGARSSGQSVGLYVDNVPYLDKSTFDFELTDIKYIEVLRGPQGTLYGRNAMGGIVNIQTLSPFEYQGTKASVSGGNQGQWKIKASHFGKISQTAAFLASAYYNRQNGFFKNWTEGKEDERIDSEESAGGRLKLSLRPTSSFSASYSLQADYTDQGAFPYGLYNLETGQIAPIQINDPSSYRRLMIGNHFQLEYKAEPFTLTSTTGYQFMKDKMKMDQDFSPLSIFILHQKQRQNAYSEEVTIKSHAERNYKWSFGAYGFYDDLHIEGPVTFKEDGVEKVLQPVFDRLNEAYPQMPVRLQITDKELYIPGNFATPSYGVALFHQSTYDNLFTERLSLTAGIRADYEKQKMNYDSEAKMNMKAIFITTGREMDISQMYEASAMNERLSQDFWQILPKVSLKYECTPRTFTYLSASKGYKAGGYNVQMSADLMQGRMQYDMMKAFEKMIGTAVPEPPSAQEIISYKPETS